MENTLSQLLANDTPVRGEGKCQNPTTLDRERWELLDDLQNNILSSHRKSNTNFYFLRFPDGDPTQWKYLLGMLARTGIEREVLFRTLRDPDVVGSLPEGTFKEFLQQTGQRSGPLYLDEETYKKITDFRLVSERDMGRQLSNGKAPAYIVSLLLSSKGYKKLGGLLPEDPAFGEGMAARKQKLNDVWPKGEKTGPNEEKDPYSDADALLVVAFDGDPKAIGEPLEVLESVVKRFSDCVHIDRGQVLRTKDKDGAESKNLIEPFGFADGVSQPRFYERDPGLPPPAHEVVYSSLGVALVPDPNGRTPYAAGSYFVYRKLRQDIEAFYAQAQAMATAGGRQLEEVLEELIGRKRDGSSLFGNSAEDNTFDYTKDARGERCPFHAHVRRVNPRSDVPALERRALVRRGVPYGPAIERKDNGEPKLTGGKVQLAPSETQEPSAEVGLLFFAAQASLERQFEHIQSTWANSARFPWGKVSGADPVMGQLPERGSNANGPVREPNMIANRYRDNAAPQNFFSRGLDTEWKPVVEFKGGEYFFAPSISYLRSLLDQLMKG